MNSYDSLRHPLLVSLIALYLIASVAAFLTYAFDKSASRKPNARRVRERTLHLLGIAGGWPGALLAQRLFRHKSRKRSFQIVFWTTVMLNGLALICTMVFAIPR